MRPRTYRLAAVGVVALTALVSAALYPRLPAEMATHWNAQGEVDGTLSRTVGAFFVPALMAATLALFRYLPRIDPRGESDDAFGGAYWAFVAFFSGFLGYVHGLVLAWNLGVEFELGQALAPAVAALFYAVGVLTERVESNWFVGVRTPWTLGDEEVWRRTHARTATLFKLSAAVPLLGVVYPDRIVWFVVGPAVLVSAFSVGYSFLAHRTRPDR